MTPQRQSAFSFVQFEPAQLPPKTTNKRKSFKNAANPEKKSEAASPKRQKKVQAPVVKKQTRTAKNAPLQAECKEEKTDNRRETRSQKRNSNEILVNAEETKAEPVVAAKEFKSPLKPAPKRRNVTRKSLEVTTSVADDSGRRVTRSRSMKNWRGKKEDFSIARIEN
jgi:hypothetical protein